MTTVSRWRTRLRARLSQSTPNVLTLYPFEVLSAVVGLVIGLPLLIGLAAPTSLAILLPSVIYWLYAVAMTLGAATTGVGLKMQSPLLLASGLQLSGGAYIVYGLAVVALAGLGTAWAAFGCFTVLGIIALVRARHFRRLLDIAEGAAEIVRSRP